MKTYYEQRAAEYDDWYHGTGLFTARERPGWHAELVRLQGLIAELPAARTLDVACGTGFLTRHLHGEVTALDQSPAMCAITRERCPGVDVVNAEALPLPFAGDAFERVLAGHFYGHLAAGDREQFVAEARRVATELVVVDTALRDGVGPEEWQERVLNDGSRHEVYKRFFTGDGLAAELGGGEVMLDGHWFVVVRA